MILFGYSKNTLMPLTDRHYYKHLADGAVEKKLTRDDSQTGAKWSSVPPESFLLVIHAHCAMA